MNVQSDPELDSGSHSLDAGDKFEEPSLLTPEELDIVLKSLEVLEDDKVLIKLRETMGALIGQWKQAEESSSAHVRQVAKFHLRQQFNRTAEIEIAEARAHMVLILVQVIDDWKRFYISTPPYDVWDSLYRLVMRLMDLDILVVAKIFDIFRSLDGVENLWGFNIPFLDLQSDFNNLTGQLNSANEEVSKRRSEKDYTDFTFDDTYLCGYTKGYLDRIGLDSISGIPVFPNLRKYTIAHKFIETLLDMETIFAEITKRIRPPYCDHQEEN